MTPKKIAKKRAISVEKRIQFTGLCTIKVSERDIPRQMKVSKTGVHNIIENFKEKVLLRAAKKSGRSRIPLLETLERPDFFAALKSTFSLNFNGVMCMSC